MVDNSKLYLDPLSLSLLMTLCHFLLSMLKVVFLLVTLKCFKKTLVMNGRDMPGEAFPEVKVNFQETFLGHTSSISRCRFSASGNNIASASIDGTVRIWTYEPSTPASRNATIYCGAEIMSLDWDLKSDRLLLIGTADGGIKAWNVDAKRVVCDLNTGEAFPSVLDIKCSPVEPIFVSAAASRRFFDPKASRHCRHEMALDAHGRRLLVTSSSVKAPIYQVRGPLEGMKTLAHNAAITTVDWHPTLPIFLTGSADHSVRVSSIP
ncbi:WD repeat-containing protein 91 [Tripterygium wilfordii]|uniref:WD repeat-containing protein 91 n=1 Tax=Tripterygium wilfordii TaxID=458696 RepID=A0A7J7CBH7_TRIWF|nr:WD repeat-containing protein 91 [Tripterygium wilfordii]